MDSSRFMGNVINRSMIIKNRAYMNGESKVGDISY